MSEMHIRNFVRDWKKQQGYEKGEAQKFWLAFIRDVFDIYQPEKFVDFETQVKIDGNTKFIDAYLLDSKVIIEQKSSNVKLDAAVFQQAKRYNDALNYGRKARWIVTCNFSEFQIYNMETLEKPTKILLDELPQKFHAFDFLIRKNRRNAEIEKALNFEVGSAIQKLYDTMRAHYKDKNSPETFNSLNKLCVRLVFCFYAESADIFPEFKMFSDYLQNYNNEKISFRAALIELFNILNTPVEKRSPYIDDTLKKFPYVDGGLFDDENFDFPEFDTRVRYIFFELAKLKWKDIDPTIFGAVFESTLDPANSTKNIRRVEGIHYTAPANIQKVIKPLFLDELYQKFNAANSRADLFNLQNEIAGLKFLDPACGSGNFLTETYLLLRELENLILEVLVADGVKFTENPVKVSIENFFGIEINDFAVAVAKTALWISEIQMRQKTADIINLPLAHFPLSKIPNIICKNALTFDWKNLIAPQDLNFIIGNPPFIGTKGQNAAQKADILAVCKDFKQLDYVACWYKKASDFIQNSKIRCAFVSTNSITQGEQVAPLWKNLNCHIDFAYKTFKWFSESDNVAQVHIVIIGFSVVANLQKKIFSVQLDKDDDGKKIEKISCVPAKNINGYLLDAPNVYIEKRKAPLCNVPEMIYGNKPTEGGNLIIEAEDYEKFIEKEPLAKKYIRPLLGSEEFINNKKRYCLWLVNCPPNELRKMKTVYKRVQAVKEFRLKSQKAQTRKDAETPALFQEIRQPETDYILVPCHSGESRKYIPFGFVKADVISTNANLIIPNAGLYEFGILTSSVHMAWAKTVCGYLGTSYRYSASIVYNNFVWCTATAEQRKKIEFTAQKILDVRKKYPQASLADLYDETAMPSDLRRAHAANDAAVMAAYGFKAEMTEAEIVGELFKLYLKLTK